jgi:hypothetical protein
MTQTNTLFNTRFKFEKGEIVSSSVLTQEEIVPLAKALTNPSSVFKLALTLDTPVQDVPKLNPSVLLKNALNLQSEVKFSKKASDILLDYVFKVATLDLKDKRSPNRVNLALTDAPVTDLLKEFGNCTTIPTTSVIKVDKYYYLFSTQFGADMINYFAEVFSTDLQKTIFKVDLVEKKKAELPYLFNAFIDVCLSRYAYLTQNTFKEEYSAWNEMFALLDPEDKNHKSFKREVINQTFINLFIEAFLVKYNRYNYYIQNSSHGGQITTGLIADFYVYVPYIKHSTEKDAAHYDIYLQSMAFQNEVLYPILVKVLESDYIELRCSSAYWRSQSYNDRTPCYVGAGRNIEADNQLIKSTNAKINEINALVNSLELNKIFPSASGGLGTSLTRSMSNNYATLGRWGNASEPGNLAGIYARSKEIKNSLGAGTGYASLLPYPMSNLRHDAVKEVFETWSSINRTGTNVVIVPLSESTDPELSCLLYRSVTLVQNLHQKVSPYTGLNYFSNFTTTKKNKNARTIEAFPHKIDLVDKLPHFTVTSIEGTSAICLYCSIHDPKAIVDFTDTGSIMGNCIGTYYAAGATGWNDTHMLNIWRIASTSAKESYTKGLITSPYSYLTKVKVYYFNALLAEVKTYRPLVKEHPTAKDELLKGLLPISDELLLAGKTENEILDLYNSSIEQLYSFVSDFLNRGKFPQDYNEYVKQYSKTAYVIQQLYFYPETFFVDGPMEAKTTESKGFNFDPSYSPLGFTKQVIKAFCYYFQDYRNGSSINHGINTRELQSGNASSEIFKQLKFRDLTSLYAIEYTKRWGNCAHVQSSGRGNVNHTKEAIEISHLRGTGLNFGNMLHYLNNSLLTSYYVRKYNLDPINAVNLVRTRVTPHIEDGKFINDLLKKTDQPIAKHIRSLQLYALLRESSILFKHNGLTLDSIDMKTTATKTSSKVSKIKPSGIDWISIVNPLKNYLPAIKLLTTSPLPEIIKLKAAPEETKPLVIKLTGNVIEA